MVATAACSRTPSQQDRFDGTPFLALLASREPCILGHVRDSWGDIGKRMLRVPLSGLGTVVPWAGLHRRKTSARCTDTNDRTQWLLGSLVERGRVPVERVQRQLRMASSAVDA